MSNWDRVERLLGSDALDRLRQKKVGVVGLGSGGGYVAVALAMSGVAQFVLIDPDELSPQNIVRHVADQRWIGQPKVEAIAELIRQRNQTATVDVFVGRVEDHDNVLLGLDLLVVGVDGEQTKYLINELCLAQNMTAIYAGVYERGEGGDVVTIVPHEGPCYACWAENLRDGLVAPTPDAVTGNLDYGQIGPDGTLKAEPALWLDVVRVANTQANIALNVLLAETSAVRDLPANTVIIANQFLEILEGQQTLPFGVEWVEIAQNPACLVCGTSTTASRLANDLSLDALLGATDDETWQEEKDDSE